MSDAEFDALVDRVAERIMQRITVERGVWTLADVAHYLGRSQSWVRKMVYLGKLPRPDIGGGQGATMGWYPNTIKGAKIL